LALGCTPSLVSRFDRKHYFYHDLPHGFQVTQKYQPLATDGTLELNDGRRVRIQQIQLEQASRSVAVVLKMTKAAGHREDDIRPAVEHIPRRPEQSRRAFDRNHLRSQPEVSFRELQPAPNCRRSAQEAVQYVTKLRRLLRCIGASDGDMEKGSLRIDANVSVKPTSSTELGTRCEIKNINSIRFMNQAITCEVDRQTALLEAGQTVPQQTRGYDPISRSTFRLRSKEDAPDYRYMPDPELPPLVLDAAFVQQVQDAIPELPDAMQRRLEEQYQLSKDVAGRLVGIAEHDLPPGQFGPGVAYFEQVATEANPKLAANWSVAQV
jgi:aspartyl-tRNA(Asn)/glutamyl-tRNA(Gln) amidotransferase subunit B